MADLCYNGSMRLILLLGTILFVGAALRMPVASAGTTVLGPAEHAAVRLLLHTVEAASILGKTGDCATLSPIPLYAGGPSLDDWQSFCEAVTQRNATHCESVSAMLTPDLRTFCMRSFVPSPS